MKKTCNLNKILLIPAILFFLPAFCISISFLGGAYLYYYFALYFIIITFVIIDNKVFFQKIIFDTFNTPLKYLLIVLTLIVINSTFLSFCDVISFKQLIRSIILQLFLCIIPIVFYYTYIINKYITFKNFIRFFIQAFWLVLIIGFISYIGQLLNIEIINSCFDILANQRFLVFSIIGFDKAASNYTSFGLPRLDNLYAEPAFYARYLLIFLPLVYSIGCSKLKVSKNKYFNLLIKKTIIFFTLLSILLTLSPIYFVFTAIVSLIYFYKKILNFAIIQYKRFFLLIFFVVFLIFLFNIFFTSETFLSRISNVVASFGDFQKLIYLEGSLATRIINFVNTFYVFINHFFTGVGIGNLPYYQLDQLYHSPLPLSFEIIQNMEIAITTNTKFAHNRAFVYAFLAEHGIFIFCAFAYFHYKLFTLLNKIKNIYRGNYYLYTISTGLVGIWISITILAFYHTNFTDPEVWLVYALMAAFINYVKKGRVIYEKNNLYR